MMDMMDVSPGQSVLLLWSGNLSPELLKNNVEKLKNKVGSEGRIQVENIERLQMSSHTGSTFDVAISGVIPPSTCLHSTEVLGEICRVLKPNGTVILSEPVNLSETGNTLKTSQKLLSVVKVSGFVDTKEPITVAVSSEDKESIKSGLTLSRDFEVVLVTAKKPSYEVGSTAQLKLSFAKKKTEPPKPDVAKVWTLSANDMLDDDVELIDDDKLLDENDLKRPEPSSLKAKCGDAPKKKKACKNCTCGLAEELENEGKSTKPKAATSACGNSTINILTENGVYIEPMSGSLVKMAALSKTFVNGHILSFDVNMTSSDGVVFYLLGQGRRRSEFIALEVANGHFRYHIKCGYLDALLTITDIRANDRKWHTIQFFRRSTRGNLKVDGKRYFHPLSRTLPRTSYAGVWRCQSRTSPSGTHDTEIDEVHEIKQIIVGHYSADSAR
ncbi:hypothetical protein FSP39_002595 [Pinctada imbricata]|uniref:Laminin G domain-containing protein n=1 Tax=Pinctada imbricata TaxID=66713 RepID=A0AA88XQ17_PINIB|nr:hypothetical protein FSP39_002595 [Pinctada imbricata]